MKKHLFFISSVTEAEQLQGLINKLGKNDLYNIVSNNPLANLYFDEQKIPHQDSGIYFPKNKNLRQNYWNLVKIVKEWPKGSGIESLLSYGVFGLGEIIGFSLIIYLCEVEHSVLTAENMLREYQPDCIYLTPEPGESPFRRYQTENLNLENIALFNLAKIKSIPIKLFAGRNYDKKIFLETGAALAQTLKYSIGQLTAGSAKINQKPVAVLSNHYQLKSLNPLLQKLAKSIDYLALGYADSAQSKQLKSKGINFVRLDGLFPDKQNIESTKLAHLIKYFNLWIKHQPSIKKYFDGKNPCYWPMIKRKFEYYFLAEFPQIIEYLELGKKLFSGGKTKIFLASATNDIASKCYALAASRQGAKVIELQHGMVIYDEEWPFRANQIHAVWGEPVIKIMNQGKRNKTSFAVTGFPYFDKYKSVKPLKHTNIKTPTILILATFPVAADRLIAVTSPYKFMEIIFGAIGSQYPKCKIIFRPHPSCNAAWVQKMAKAFSCRLIYDQRMMPMEKVITSCDAVISNFTSAIVDAMFFGKPVLLFPFANDSSLDLNNHSLITSGAVTIFRSSGELKDRLANIFRDRIYADKMKTGQKQFLGSYCSVNGKPASGKLLNLITRELQE